MWSLADAASLHSSSEDFDERILSFVFIPDLVSSAVTSPPPYFLKACMTRFSFLAYSFLIFLIPGVPKDLCNYAAGISEMKLKHFLAASLLGRTPGMMGSLLIGKHIGTSSYTTAIIIGVVAVLLFVLGLVFHKKIFELAEKRGYSDKTESIYNDQNDQND